MQKNKTPIVLVRTDLLVQEGNFKMLRNFVANLDLQQVRYCDELDYDLEEDTVVLLHQKHNPNTSSIYSLCEEIQRGFIAINFSNLKQLLSL